MKFTPRLLKENVNISPSSPLRELFVLVLGIFGGLLLIYIILGLTLDVLVERMPAKFEQAIGNFFSKTYNLKEPSSAAEIKIQKLLDDLVSLMPMKHLSSTVHLQDSPDFNALALPGGHILIFSGLLKEIESENELSMVLAHELGHFAYRDHLRGLGRGLVLVFISAVFFGTDSAVANFSQKILITADLKFSRQQEIAADIFAIGLLHRKYGHVAGAYDFFERAKGKNNLPRFAKFLSTHPYPVDRINLLKKNMEKKRYLMGEKIPLSPTYKDYKEKNKKLSEGTEE